MDEYQLDKPLIVKENIPTAMPAESRPVSVSNNEVAALSSEQSGFKKRDRQIMNSPQDAAKGIHIVSLGDGGPRWAGQIESKVGQSADVLWDFQACGLPYVWSHYGARGEGVNVFVLDSGIDRFHPSFAHSESIKAMSFVTGCDPQDGCGHGTWVAGKIAGMGIGLAPKCNFYSLKVLDDSGTGTVDFTNKALEWILRQPVQPHVINMSLGTPRKSALQEKLLWQLYKKGCIIIVAAGNEGDDEKFYPAAYSGVVAVAAVDKNKSRASFSNFGANIAVSAPGVACYSAYPGGSFRLLEGTSMASPTVAGLVTLGLCYARKRSAANPSYLRDLVLSSLEETAQDLGTVGRDPYYGFGCIDGKAFFARLELKLNALVS